jgi:hypothetical protein
MRKTDLIDLLNDAGRDGWELDAMAYMKRSVAPPKHQVIWFVGGTDRTCTQPRKRPTSSTSCR